MDDLDRNILALLGADARLSVATLARRLKVARSTLQARLERLESSGVIAGYTLRLGDQARTTRLHATALLATEPRSLPALLTRLKAIPEVERVQTCAGRFDVMVQIAAADPASLDHTMGQIVALPGITQAETLVHLATRLERSA
jgi:DNA-binding Lrp family transcriptional regulator